MVQNKRSSDGNPALLQYLQELYPADPSPVFQKAREGAEKFGLGHISLSPVEGRLLSFVVALKKCRNFVEIGTLTGYSALWILESLAKDGHLYCLEKDQRHADCAKNVLNGDQRATVLVGDALVLLKEIEAQGPFDGVFIDANKSAYSEYLDWTEKNLSPGGIVIVDNALLRGAVYEPAHETSFNKKQIDSVRRVNARLSDHAKYRGVLVPTAEGMYIAQKL